MAFILCAVIIIGVLIILKLCKTDEPDDTWLNYKSQSKNEKYSNSTFNFVYWPEPTKLPNFFDKPKSTYDLLLERKEWKECREWVFSNKGRICCKCYSTKNLQIHHKFYLAYPNDVKVNPWEYPLSCFKVLCENCHRKEHQTHRIKVYRISYHSDPKQFKGN